MLENPISEPVRLTESELKRFDDVDDIIGRSVAAGDPLIAMEYGLGLGRNATVSGLQLAKLLYRLQENWALFKSAGIEDDLVTVASVHMGISGQTVSKYIRMWKNIFENEGVDDDTKVLLKGRPIGDLLLLQSVIGEGKLVGDELHTAALTLDHNGIRQKVQEKNGVQTSANNAIYIFLQMQDTAEIPAGAVWARRGKKKEVLFIVNPELSDLGKSAMERIYRGAGIQEKYVG